MKTRSLPLHRTTRHLYPIKVFKRMYTIEHAAQAIKRSKTPIIVCNNMKRNQCSHYQDRRAQILVK